MSRQNLSLVFLLLLFIAAAVNLFGAFGPELGFDALWYHLTIPKLYLTAGKIYHVPGGLLYYSEMPRLAEILYIPLLKYLGVIGPHLLSLAAGLGTAIILYELARLYLDKEKSLLAVIIFYVTPLVGWLSGSAYIDLLRTFWEIAALYLILRRKVLLAGLLMGLAISTKTLAIGSLVASIPLIFFLTRNLRSCILYLVSCILVSAPWFLSAYLNTGYPLYPIGAGILDARHTIWPQILHPWSIVIDFWKVFLTPEDSISPIYVIVIPFFFLNFRRLSRTLKPLLIYGALGYLLWWLTPRLGGGRFLLPYLPVFAVISVAVIDSVKDKLVKKALLFSVLVIAMVNIFSRVWSNFRRVPLFFGQESTTQYLCHNLDLSSTFVDCDGWFAKNIKNSDRVLITNSHNLYYVDFPFVHKSWYAGESFNYILTQGSIAPLPNWRLVYANNLTNIKLYRP